MKRGGGRGKEVGEGRRWEKEEGGGEGRKEYEKGRGGGGREEVREGRERR